jgi:cell division protein FtsL
MEHKRDQHAERWVWFALIGVAIVVIVGFVAAGYQIHHLTNEVNGMQAKVKAVQTQMSGQEHYVSDLRSALVKLGAAKFLR